MIKNKGNNPILMPLLYACIVIFIVIFVKEEPRMIVETYEEEILTTPLPSPVATTPPAPLPPYIMITGSCDTQYEGGCINVREAPSTKAKPLFIARNGIILKVKGIVRKEGTDWYEVHFDEWLRYPDRTPGKLYVSANFVEPVFDKGAEQLTASTTKTTKRIVVDLSEQMLYAYDGESLFMKEKISTGTNSNPTPKGTFTIFKKTPTRYMQGPIPGVTDLPYDLPGVPWNLYFTSGGAVIHGSYWHDQFGTEQSKGCVNLPVGVAQVIYSWADLGTTVTVRS